MQDTLRIRILVPKNTRLSDQTQLKKQLEACLFQASPEYMVDPA